MIRFCSQCGGHMRPQIPAGDQRERMLCACCGFIAYENPRILAACYATIGDRLLWMRRKTEPCAGYWVVPAGFLEVGENPEDAASRELWEETRGKVDPDKLELFAVGSLPVMAQVYLTFRGELEHADIEPTEEASEVGLFSQNEAPWDQLAYPQLIKIHQQFYTDHNKKEYGVYRGYWSGDEHFFRSISGVKGSVR